jgi:hypothetical protein
MTSITYCYISLYPFLTQEEKPGSGMVPNIFSIQMYKSKTISIERNYKPSKSATISVKTAKINVHSSLFGSGRALCAPAPSSQQQNAKAKAVGRS